MDRDNRIWWGTDKNQIPAIKRFLSEVKQGLVPETIWTYKEVGHTQDAKKEVLEIFRDDYDTILTPKPVELMKRIIRLSTDEEAIVLDSFAGSGTTAQAVLEVNAEDGGNRRFVLCQVPYETTEQKKKDKNICATVTAERVRRVIRGVPDAKHDKLRAGLGGTFTYFKLGKALRLRAILEGSALPDYESLASYVFFTATGEEFDAKKIDKQSWFIGESRHHDIFLLYEQDAEKLKQLALTLDVARALPSISGKPKLIFAPTKYLDPYFLDRLRITFQQLPYQIYKALET
jgi:adenine-specific DNA-methyltransferase